MPRRGYRSVEDKKEGSKKPHRGYRSVAKKIALSHFLCPGGAIHLYTQIHPAVFRWQEGYGAFSYARSQVPAVAQYVQNQEKHHRRKTFLEEYKDFPDKFEVDYEERYLFQPLQ